MNKVLLAIILVILVAGVAVGGIWLLKNKSKANGPLNLVPMRPAVSVPTPTPNKQETILLNIDTPKEGDVLKVAKLVVKGTTVPYADVSVDDTDTKADAKGNFTLTLTLDEGENIINVLAIDKNGLSSEKEITVTYEIAN